MAKLLAPEWKQAADRSVVRVSIKRKLASAVQEMIDSDFDSNEIQEFLGSAGITVHPVIVQNLLARRFEQQQQPRS
jgi:hypothetical protein